MVISKYTIMAYRARNTSLKQDIISLEKYYFLLKSSLTIDLDYYYY